jgi:drug/metabolite transporter (DMT)-like permease
MYLIPGSILITLIWGLSPFYSKHIANQNISLEILLFITSFIFFACMLIYILVTFKSHKRSIQFLDFHKKINYLHFATWVLFTYVIAMLLYYKLLEKHNTYLIVALTSIYPIVTAVFSYFIFKEKLTLIQMGAIVLIVTGLIVLVK